MNIERLVTERLQQDANGRAPDGLLATTLEEVSATPQQRALWPRRAKAASTRRSNRPLLAIAATIVLVGLLGALAVAGGRHPTEETKPTLPPTPNPATAVGSMPVAIGPLPPGRYHVDAQLENYWPPDSGSQPPDLLPLDANRGAFMGAMARVTFDLPVGWAFDGRDVFKAGSAGADSLTLHVGGIARVYSDPCRWSGETSVDPASVWSVEGLSRAFTEWWPTATGPTPATIGGLAGRYVETKAPDDVVTAACDYGQSAWYEFTGGGRGRINAGELTRLWLVDVDGSSDSLLGGVMVVDARSRSGTPEGDLAELQHVVESIVIDRLPASALAKGGPPRPLPSSGPLSPGTYSMANPYTDADNGDRNCAGGCSAYDEIVFNVRTDWAIGDGFVNKHLNLPSEVGFSAWTVDEIYNDSCHWRQGGAAPLATIHSDDNDRFHLAGSELLIEQIHAKSAVAVVLGGVLAVKLEQSVPASLDVSTCDEGQYRIWSQWDVAGGGNSHHAAGQVDTIYIVDVDRRPLFIDVSRMPLASANDIAELQEVIDTLLVR